MKHYLLILSFLLLSSALFSQKRIAESVSYFDISTPVQPLDESIKTYRVVVNTPYELTSQDIETESLAAFEEEKAAYDELVKQSELEYQEKLANHDKDVQDAKDVYDKRIKDFKELSLLERLSLTEQGKKPELRIPKRPVYVKPREPKYREPNLNDYLIFDEKSMADDVELLGFEKEDNGLLIEINFTKMNFQQNGGQTNYSQPTTLTLTSNGSIIHEKVFNEESKFLTNTSSNKINLSRYEKSNVLKLMGEIETYLNDQFGYKPISTSITIAYPKNKKRQYDALEKAKVKAISAYRKLNKDADIDSREIAKKGLLDIQNTWREELNKINYQDKKAVMNSNVAKMIFFNLLRVDLSLKDKAAAEKTFNEIQDKIIDLNLSDTEERTLASLEKQMYKL